MNKPKILLRVDPSSIKESDCLEKFRLSNISGYTSKIPDYKMSYGTAFHKGVAHYVKTSNRGEAIMLAASHLINDGSEIPDTDYRTPSHVADTLGKYLDLYGTGDNFTHAKVGDQVAVELPFGIPYRSYETVDVVVCGVVDSIGFWNRNIKCFKDIKSTSAYDPDVYFKSYQTNVQFMLYSWAIKQLGWADHYIPGIVDGVFISKSGAKFERSQLIDYREDQIDELMEWFSERVDAIVDCIEGRKPWRRNFTRCQTAFGLCQFSRVCSAQAAFREGILESTFSVRVYDPSTFGEK